MIDAFTISQVYAPPTMHDKPKAAPANEFHLSDHSVLALCGRDSIAFAQAQCMNDVALLGDGQWQWNGWLNAKGRVIALFALVRLNPETLWLLLPDVPAEDLAEQLRRYVFRSKVSLTARNDLQVIGSFAVPLQAQSNQIGLLGEAAGETVELDLSAQGGFRRLCIRATSATEDAACMAQWAAFDLHHGLPRLPASQAEHWTPQQLGLDRLAAFSVKKGCYPGQEIVARTHFLGQTKRTAGLLHSSRTLVAGEDICDSQQRPSGKTVACRGALAMAILPTQDLAEDTGNSLFIAGQRVELVAFLGGLQR